MPIDIDTIKIKENQVKNKRLIEAYTERARKTGIRNDLKRLPRISDGEVLRRREEKRHLRAYMTQVLNYVLDEIPACDCVFILVDEDGYMIKIKASEADRLKLQKLGIVNGCCFGMEQAGPNAIAIGQAEHHSMRTAGKENYQTILQDLAIYYSPIDVAEKGRIDYFGGIALLVPECKQNDAYMIMVTGLSGSFAIRMQMAWNTSDAYEVDQKGLVLLDINTQNQDVYITHHNYNMFDMLGLPRMSMKESYFRNAEEYFDPLPLNKNFWQIVRGLQEVKDMDLTISVQGKPVDVVVSTTLKNGMNSAGVLMSITSRRQIARQAAEKTGNNAILSFDNIIGNSPIMRSRIKRAKLLARTDSNIMLLGESGVGKDVFAQAIHNQSARWKEPFVAVNCGALPRDLIASELFGYDGGAFTGAKKQGNIGKFELANGGTLFLDEIGEMPLDLQATLLRAVEQKQFMRLGSSKVVHADVKIISATNVDITKMIQEKKFRADLYYRLCTMSVFLPPLRERGNDIILLAEHFIRTISDKTGREDYMVIDEDSREFLKSCEWQGNVRELQNLIECLVQLYPDPVITTEMIRENINPAYYTGILDERLDEPEDDFRMSVPAASSAPAVPAVSAVPSASAVPPVSAVPSAPAVPPVSAVPSAPAVPPVSAVPSAPVVSSAPTVPEKRSLRLPLTREDILTALERTGGNRSKAADLLGVGRRTLYRYIDQLGIGYK